MRIKVLAFTASLLLISNVSAGIPQTPTTTTSAPQRDATALAVLQQAATSLNATSTISLSSFVVQGTVTRQFATFQEAGTVRFECSAPTICRLDLVTPSSSRTVVVNGNSGFEIQDGVTVYLPYHALVNHPIKYLPQFSEIAAGYDQDFNVVYVGQEKVNGASAYRIHVEPFLSGMTDRMTALYSLISGVDLYIDVSSLLLVKRSQQLPSYQDMSSTLLFEQYFSNYQTIAGVLVPTQITALVAGQKYLEMQFSQIQPNASISTSDFTVSQ